MKSRSVKSAPSPIAVAVEYIHQNACQGIRVDHVAKEMGYCCQKDFDRNFQAATGRAPAEAILERQLQEAERLLLETEFSIAFIAGSTGFANQRAFSRAWRTAQGQSPSASRARKTGVKPTLDTPARPSAVRPAGRGSRRAGSPSARDS